MFLNDGSGKTLRERDILLDFCNRVRRTFLFQAYDPDTLRFLSAGPVYKVIVVRINKKDKSSDSGKEALWEKGRKVCMYLGGGRNWQNSFRSQ